MNNDTNQAKENTTSTL
jgi:hypothetical protein